MPIAPAAPRERRPLFILCVIAVLALLWATMWPFNPFPHNDVAWLPDANGIRFYGSGIVLGNGPLQPPSAPNLGDACSIEIYLRSVKPKEAADILTFSSGSNPDALILRQWHELLMVNRQTPIRWHSPSTEVFGVDHVLRQGRLVLVTISSGSDGSTMYIDGKLVSSAPDYRVHCTELHRQIVIGSSPVTFEVWRGEIHGLAIYDEKLSPAEAAAHYAEWSGTSATSPSWNRDNLVARYDFHERSENTIHNQIATSPVLMIPRHYFIPRKAMLASVADEFEWSPVWRRDVVDNILGFMPLGFVLCGFFALSRSRTPAVLISTLCGGLLSFSIEVLQYYIPRRGSGWTDVITNTTGTLLGALIARPELVRAALRLVYLIPAKRDSEAD